MDETGEKLECEGRRNMSAKTSACERRVGRKGSVCVEKMLYFVGMKTNGSYSINY